VDTIENLGGLRFNDFSIQLSWPGQAEAVVSAMADLDASKISTDAAKTAITESSQTVPYVTVNINGRATVLPNMQDAPGIVWLNGFSQVLSSLDMINNKPLEDIYSSMNYDTPDMLITQITNALKTANITGDGRSPLDLANR
jgi:hypothetical protein